MLDAPPVTMHLSSPSCSNAEQCSHAAQDLEAVTPLVSAALNLDCAVGGRCLHECRRWRKPEAEDVVGYNSSSDVSLRPEDVILVDVKIDLTNGENNPVDRVRAAGNSIIYNL